jgi:tetratricopeptide (TPR) repeat protein
MSLVQRDYILRIIEQLGEVLTHVLHLRRGGSIVEARQYINQSIGRLVGIAPEEIAARSASDLADEIRGRLASHRQKQLVSDQIVVLAGLLHESAHVHDDAGDADAARAERLKALELYLEVLTVDEPGCVPAEAAVDTILAELTDDPPVPVMQRLVAAYERSGRYDDAEDWLFHVLDAAPDNSAIVAEGIAFYERLLTLDDATLAAGNLPTDEALASLAELLERQANHAR